MVDLETLFSGEFKKTKRSKKKKPTRRGEKAKVKTPQKVKKTNLSFDAVSGDCFERSLLPLMPTVRTWHSAHLTVSYQRGGIKKKTGWCRTKGTGEKAHKSISECRR